MASIPFNTNFELVLKGSSDVSCAQRCPSVSDSVLPNLLYCRFGAAESDTGHDCMHEKASLQFNTNFQLVLKGGSDASCTQ